MTSASDDIAFDESGLDDSGNPIAAPIDLAPRELPFATPELAGIGGSTRNTPEDFRVEENPAYLPSGTGEHLYLRVEKRDASTADAARAMASVLGVRDRDVGYAGQKDRRAVTTQWLSIHLPGGATRHPELTARPPVIEDDRFSIREWGWHSNKLRLGHLRGNRFVLVVRELAVEPAEALERASRILEALTRRGLPNFYGEQRFGRDADNALLGAALLGVVPHPQLGRARRDRHLRRLALSALQSELFNRCLIRRMTDDTWCRALPGDVLRRRDSGGLFVCEQPNDDQPRIDAHELDVTGPMPGPRERPAARDVAKEIEDGVLAEVRLTRDDFAKAGGEAEGTRRPLRIPVENASARIVDGDALELSFELPPGSYATRVLAEVQKT